MKDKKNKSYALRIDAHLVEPLQKLKKDNRRSMNAEINAALESWVARDPVKKGAKAASKETGQAPEKATAASKARLKKDTKKKEVAAATAAS